MDKLKLTFSSNSGDGCLKELNYSLNGKGYKVFEIEWTYYLKTKFRSIYINNLVTSIVQLMSFPNCICLKPKLPVGEQRNKKLV